MKLKPEDPSAKEPTYFGRKYRIFPNQQQQVVIKSNFIAAGVLHDAMLRDYKKILEKTGKVKVPNYSEYKYQKCYSCLKDSRVDSCALNNVGLNLQTAYDNHRCNPKHYGIPKFWYHDSASYTTNNVNNSIRIEPTDEFGCDRIKLPKMAKPVNIELHYPLPEHCTIKKATISRNSIGDYYVSLLLKLDPEYEVAKVEAKQYVGLDYKMNGLYVDSQGEEANYPKFLQQAKKKLANKQHQLSRKVKGSKNYEKKRKQLAKLCLHIANQRKDFQHKMTHKLAEKFDVVGIEDLSIKAMAKRKRGRKFSFGKSVADNGWNAFVTKLEYKLRARGKLLIKVGKWLPSSQCCSACGYRNKEVKKLSIRKWVCPQCGIKHDRDVNAAINICKEAKRLYLSF